MVNPIQRFQLPRLPSVTVLQDGPFFGPAPPPSPYIPPNAPTISALSRHPQGPHMAFRDISELLDLHSSRYVEDFDEVRPLGRGAFGKVMCARNKLDGVEYAVKRIRLRSPPPTASRKSKVDAQESVAGSPLRGRPTALGGVESLGGSPRRGGATVTESPAGSPRRGRQAFAASSPAAPPVLLGGDDLSDVLGKEMPAAQGPGGALVDGLEKILREVKVQARLSHPNVVRYYGCWVEHVAPMAVSSSSSSESSSELESSGEEIVAMGVGRRMTVDTFDADVSIVFETSQGGRREDDDEEDEDEDDDDEEDDSDEDGDDGNGVRFTKTGKVGGDGELKQAGVKSETSDDEEWDTDLEDLEAKGPRGFSPVKDDRSVSPQATTRPIDVPRRIRPIDGSIGSSLGKSTSDGFTEHCVDGIGFVAYVVEG
ncbi:hypothetical protein BC829DRAFT_270721 [Chytridium lagenaria]|nr:hypothetical protein BC829DRAFT_270721 [Chytridium lagenaria]